MKIDETANIKVILFILSPFFIPDIVDIVKSIPSDIKTYENSPKVLK